MPQEQPVINVPLLAPNQQAPKSGSPFGRLRKITNGIAVKFRREDGGLKVEKRDGWSQLSKTVFDVRDMSSLGTGGLASPAVLAELDGGLVGLGGGLAMAYAPSRAAWGQLPAPATSVGQYHATASPFRRPVLVSEDTIDYLDAACIDEVRLRTFRKGGNVYRMINDADEEPIMAPTAITSGRIKTVTDGAKFFTFYDGSSTTIRVLVNDSDGSAVSVSTVVTSALHAGEYWDIAPVPTGGCVLAIRGATTDVELYFVTCPATTIGVVHVNNATVTCNNGLAFLKSGDASHVYLAATNITWPGTHAINAYQIDLAGSVTHSYAIAAILPDRYVSNLTGYVVPGTSDVWVSWSHAGVTAGLGIYPLNNLTMTVFCPSGGSASAATTVRSVTLASRPFLLGTRWVVLTYYASCLGVSIFPRAEPTPQPTYFLLDIAAQQIVGRLEYRTASMNWTTASWDPGTSDQGPNFFQVPSPFQDGLSVPHVPCGFAANLTTVRVDVSDVVVTDTVTPQVGYLDIRFDGPAVPVQYANEVLLGGAMARTFGGSAAPSVGIELGGEAPSLASDATSGRLHTTAQYSYVVWYTVLHPDGTTTSSRVSAPVQGATAGADKAIKVTIQTLRVTTHEKVLIQVGRTVWDSGTSSMLPGHHKITVDQSTAGDVRVPIVNDPTVDTIDFIDTIADTTAAIGPLVYTDDGGQLDRDPGPPFSVSCASGDRVFVAGYSDRIHYSFSVAPGESVQFNEDEMYVVLPTAKRITGLSADENGRVLAYTETNCYVIETATGLLDGTGAGANPTPRLLTAPIGCQLGGFTVNTGQGVLFTSSQGGIWLTPRGLEDPTFAGAPVEDETGQAFVGAAVDENQRIYFANASGMVVYDQVSNIWSVFTTPTAPAAVGTWQGQVVYADSAGQVWRLTPGTSHSDAGAFVATVVYVDDISPATVHGYTVLYEVYLLGKYAGAHTLIVDVTYDGSDSTAEVFQEDFTSPVNPYRFQFAPKINECNSLGLILADSDAGGGPSGGFVLEGLGLYIGTERGGKWVPRVPPA